MWALGTSSTGFGKALDPRAAFGEKGFCCVLVYPGNMAFLWLMGQDRSPLCISHPTQIGAFSVEQCSPQPTLNLGSACCTSFILQLEKLCFYFSCRIQSPPSPALSSLNVTLRNDTNLKRYLASKITHPYCSSSKFTSPKQLILQPTDDFFSVTGSVPVGPWCTSLWPFPGAQCNVQLLFIYVSLQKPSSGR